MIGDLDLKSSQSAKEYLRNPSRCSEKTSNRIIKALDENYSLLNHFIRNRQLQMFEWSIKISD